VPDIFMRARDALLLDWDMIAIAYLRPFLTKDLAVTGDTAVKKLVLAEWGLQVNNEAALGGIYDLKAA